MFTFRAPKKKKNKQGLRKRSVIGGSTVTTLQEEEEEEDDNDEDDGKNASSSSEDEKERSKRRRKQKKKSSRSSVKMEEDVKKKKKKRKREKKVGGGGGAMSFDPDEEEMLDQDENDSDDDIPYKKKKKKHRKEKKKKGGSGGMGFGGGGGAPLDYDDDEDEEEEPTIKTKESSALHDNDNLNNNNRDNGEEEGKKSLYGKEQLAKLKSEQKVYVAPTTTKEGEEKTDEKERKAVDTTKAQTAKNVDSELTKSSNGLGGGDYIPLSSSSNKKNGSGNVILTGDEAFSYQDMEPTSLLSQLGDDGTTKNRSKANEPQSSPLFEIHDKTETEKNDEEVDEGVKRWEEEIERRAGLNSSQTSKPPPAAEPIHQSPSSATNKPSSPPPSSTSLSNMKSSILKTLSTLKINKESLASTIQQRNIELQTIQTENYKHSTSLDKIGKAFDYYQQLRLEMIPWIGALREIQSKVDIVETNIQELYSEIHQERLKKWREWENDVVETLRDCNILEKMIGRQVENSKEKVGGNIEERDEFDRDMTSFALLARRRRRIKRGKVWNQSRERRLFKKQKQQHDASSKETQDLTISDIQDAYYDTDNDISNEDLTERTNRRTALCDAIQVVLSNVNEEYTALQQLIAIFEKWQSDYRQDFEKCFAYMSFIDLASVLVKVEICDQLDLLGLQKKRGFEDNGDIEEEESTCTLLSDFCFYHDLKKFSVTTTKADDDNADSGNGRSKRENDVLLVLCQKVFIPHLVSLMQTTATTIPAENDEDNDDKKGVGGGGYDPFSSQQSRSLTQFYTSLLECLAKHDQEESRTKIEKAIVNCFRQTVHDMAIPLINISAFKDRLIAANDAQEDDEDKKEKNDAIIYATMGQTLRLKKLLENILSYWLPTFLENGVCRKELAKFILMDIIAERILPALTAWKDILATPNGIRVFMTKLDTNTTDTMTMDGKTNIATTVLIGILEAVKKTGWLDGTEFMLYAAPLRAAASVHGLL